MFEVVCCRVGAENKQRWDLMFELWRGSVGSTGLASKGRARTYVCMYVCMGGWVGGWVGGWMGGWMDGEAVDQ
jgi:hypothetical protein